MKVVGGLEIVIISIIKLGNVTLTVHSAKAQVGKLFYKTNNGEFKSNCLS